MSTRCTGCGYEAAEQPATPLCPSCGRPWKSSRGPSVPGLGLISRYFSTVGQILTRPADYFRRMPTHGGMSGPLAFALVCHWLGSSTQFLWSTLLGGAVKGYMERLMQAAQEAAPIDSLGRNAAWKEFGDRLADWFWGAGSVLIDPFQTLVALFFTASLVFVAARIFVTPGKDGAPQSVTFESALRVVSYGLTPALLAALPVIGSAVSSIGIAVVTVIAAREVYRVGNGRAILIGLFPKVLFAAILILGLFFLALLMLKVFSNTF